VWEAVEALIPTVVLTAIFIAVAVTAFRATDGARRKDRGRDEDR
jgi:multisubunit Na+/H+ antiporter MnhC subunit